MAELSRGSAVDLAEAGRELGRFDSSGWVAAIAAPVVVVVTGRDRLVPPAKQYALARASGAAVHPVDADHDACSTSPEFTAALLTALGSLAPTARSA